MFIRVKKNNNNSYAYLVENKWYKTHQQSRQKIKKYLGKVHTPEKKLNKTFEKHYKIKDIEQYINKNNLTTIFLNLIRLELLNHKFKQVKTNIWQYKNTVVDLKNKKIFNQKTKKQECIELNNNFLTQLTLTKLIHFQPPKNSTKIQIGKSLANTILASGIKLEQHLFVPIFNKIYKNLK